MCSAVCIYNQISTWAVSWMRLACIQLALHIYISCMMLSLWALSWDVYHTASSPVLLPSLLEKIICLAACQKDKLGKISHPGWKSAALTRESSHVLWGCSCWALCAFNILWIHVPCDAKGKNWFTVVNSREKWWWLVSTLSSICLLAARKKCLSFPLCP